MCLKPRAVDACRWESKPRAATATCDEPTKLLVVHSQNFGKFLANKDGEIVGRFDPSTEPQAADLIAAIEGAL